VIGLFKRRYGASPLHLIGHLAAFAIAAFALAQLITGPGSVNFVFWFVGAALLHDIVFLPLYSLLDRVAHGFLRRGGPGGSGRAERRRASVPLINHVRAPALVSGLLLLIYFPLILGPAGKGYFAATGHHPTGYLRNWLLITAALFAGSALIYAIRLRRAASP
jgi:hypothetical protein